MLKTHSCGELTAEEADKDVVLTGWVDSLRVQGKIAFLILRDREGITQCFLNPNLTNEFKDLSKESVVLVAGKVKNRPENQIRRELTTGEIELGVDKIEILSRAETPLPIEIEEETTTHLDKRLDFRFLDVRRNRIKSIFKVRAKIYQYSVEFFTQEGFINIQTPKLTQSGVESGAEEFKLDYFGKPASLSQSPQVYKQMMVASGLEKVFEIGPVFRAEKSHTTRHLTEFTGVDFEMGFVKDEHDVMDVVEKYIKFVLEKVKRECKEELKMLDIKLKVPKEIPRLEMSEVKKLLAEKGKEIPADDDLDPEGEKMISKIVEEKYGSELLFVINFPWSVRPFYHMRPKGIVTGTKSFDLIYRGVELSTGAQREHRLEMLDKQAKEKGINLKEMTFYRDIFRFGCPPHGGAGLGLDRITEQLLGLKNIREAILLPRDVERLTP
ncbi:aspartate--tRNA(Asn) ligase [Candidatus Woesearchaeota archaeon]|nr:aspartate--tRNA(Asn) ligase [Candidatus Woesearchaeota archaeon]